MQKRQPAGGLCCHLVTTTAHGRRTPGDEASAENKRWWWGVSQPPRSLRIKREGVKNLHGFRAGETPWARRFHGRPPLPGDYVPLPCDLGGPGRLHTFQYTPEGGGRGVTHTRWGPPWFTPSDHQGFILESNLSCGSNLTSFQVMNSGFLPGHCQPWSPVILCGGLSPALWRCLWLGVGSWGLACLVGPCHQRVTWEVIICNYRHVKMNAHWVVTIYSLRFYSLFRRMKVQ